ncbi:Hypothetical predicted protein [Paramuricea clavata]|uniref:Uncharacterized protein n=1 Tax=Paramuricea clavata TaxID=317549 RepID=A0A7D9LHC3_PARCT|nr:Hypothetical predicted protein [Paramuricea clavata]
MDESILSTADEIEHCAIEEIAGVPNADKNMAVCSRRGMCLRERQKCLPCKETGQFGSSVCNPNSTSCRNRRNQSDTDNSSETSEGTKCKAREGSCTEKLAKLLLGFRIVKMPQKPHKNQDRKLEVAVEVAIEVAVEVAEQAGRGRGRGIGRGRLQAEENAEQQRQEDFAESADAEISKIDDVTMGSSRGIKHDLTPNSKKSNQPRAKRSLVGGKPSGQEITDGKTKIINLLQASFIQQHGSEYLSVNQDVSLTDYRTFYVNLKHKNSFSCEDSECLRPISAEYSAVPSPSSLSPEQNAINAKELKVFQNICNLGIRGGNFKDTTELLHPSILKDFGDEVREKCPLLHSIVEALVITSHHERNVHKTNEKKVLCGHHALALLYNIRNSNCCNDFPLLFGLLCVSYGAGKQFINMLQSIGISLHFDTITNFLKQRLDNYDKIISEHAPVDIPVILLLDNINMYRGNKRHHRIFKVLGPTMWNFTVRGAIIPNFDGVRDLLDNPEMTQEQQKQLTTLKPEDLFIGMSI